MHCGTVFELPTPEISHWDYAGSSVICVNFCGGYFRRCGMSGRVLYWSLGPS